MLPGPVGADNASALRPVPREERILLVRLSHLGDVVHALPLFHALRAAHPEARIAWAVQPEFAPLVRGLAGLERVVPFERRGGARAWLALHEALARFGATLAVDAQGNLKSAFVTLCSGAPRRVGLARQDWREPLGAHVLTERAPPVRARGGGPHALDRMLGLARHLAPGSVAPRFDAGLSQGELAAGRALLAGHVGGAGAPVVLQLARAEDVRAWPLDRWARLARGLAASGRTVLVLSGPAEAEEGAQLARELGGLADVHHWVGQRGLRELAAVFAAAAERGGCFVGCDSGPLHLAVSAELPVTALCGPQDAARTGPWPHAPGAPHRALGASLPPPCAPCLARTCTHPDGPVCMHRIGVEDVLHVLSSGR